MLRVGLAGLMTVHGIAHLVGFVVPWRIVQTAEMPYSTTLLAGRLDVGDQGIRVVGLLWLVLALGFLAAAAGTWLERPDWPVVAMWMAGASLVMCVVGLPAARIGIPINVVLLAILFGGRWLGWW